jgi:P-type Ca2+ transporter type 2C
LAASSQAGWWRRLLSALREPMFLLLLAASSLYLLLGNLPEGLALLAFVLATLAMTLAQEGRTARAIEALHDLSSPRACVIRGGAVQRIAGPELVVGDLLQLSEGDRVPADAWLLATRGLRVDESLLTGEAVPVDKQAAPLPADGSPATADRGPSQLFAGTLVVQGQGHAQVTATGARSEIGRLGQLLGGQVPAPSPLQQQTTRLVRRLAVLALGLSLLLMLAYGLQRGDWLQALLAGIALAMAMLPQEYPVVMALYPTLGARRLAQQGVLTRRIHALETLGATTVLCCDKTGTLTENRMAVVQLEALGAHCDLAQLGDAPLPEAFHALVAHAVLASVPDAFDPMEQAIHSLGTRTLAGTEHLPPQAEVLHRYALSSALPALTQIGQSTPGGPRTLATKGAPEAVGLLCRLDAAGMARVKTSTDTLAAQGLRVLAVARGTPPAGPPWPEAPTSLQFEWLGLLALADPVRPEVAPAMGEFAGAGIRVLMITGDYPATALAVARQAGFGEGAQVLSGADMAALDDTALRTRLTSVSVCARIAPAQKLRIVEALKANGEVVAMTGDGVNDAPALRAAQVGIAMGGRGTDVARESAALVLVHDNFSAIVSAMRMGRQVDANLRKAMAYILAVHVPIAGMALLPVLLGWPVLLHPMHIALLEMVIDPASAVVFESEPMEGELMQAPPRPVDAPLFDRSTLVLGLLQGLVVLAAALGGFALASTWMSEPAARAFAFATLVLGNVALIFCKRSNTQPLWVSLRVRNPKLWWVVLGTVALLLLALYLPLLRGVLRFEALSAGALAAAAGLALLCALGLEGLKALVAKPAPKVNAMAAKASL